jgi:hypothetical protein
MIEKFRDRLKIEVGDKVLVVENNDPELVDYRGATGRLIRICSGDQGYVVRLGKERTNAFFFLEELARIGSRKGDEKCDTILSP